jgi:iron complex outermembrane recepter protein
LCRYNGFQQPWHKRIETLIEHSRVGRGATFPAKFDQVFFEFGRMGSVRPDAALSYSGSWFGQPFNSILEKQESYTKLDLRLTLAFNENISIQSFVNDVTDKATYTRFVWGAASLPRSVCRPAPPVWAAMLPANKAAKA